MEDSAIIDMQYKSSVLDWSRLINNPPVFIFIMLQSGRGLGEDERGLMPNTGLSSETS